MISAIKYSSEVAQALKTGKPIVALESTIISHGLPRPSNLEVAKECEAIVRNHGAVPATIALLDGKILIGLEAHELEAIANRDDISKASISKIKQELESDNQTLVDANVKDRIDDLLIDSLKLHLNALGNIARTTFDEDFIKAQRASDLAALHAQLRDWSLLLLEAANPNS